MHSSSTTSLLSLCAAHFFQQCILLCCCADVCARPPATKGLKKCFLWCCVQQGFQKLVFERLATQWVFSYESISGRRKKKSWFSKKAVYV